MKTSDVSVVTYNFKKQHQPLVRALDLKPSYEVMDSGDLAESATYVLTQVACLVVACVESKEDLVKLATLVKETKKQSSCLVKFAVFSSGQQSRQFEKSLVKLGILDVIEGNLTSKALRYKFDFWAKSLIGQLRKANMLEQREIKAAEATQQQNKKALQTTPVWLPAMANEDDIWLIGEQDCKRIINKWMVKVKGPSPYIGRWMETGRANVWKFNIKDDGRFCANGTNWYFKGSQKPEFIWKENLWLLTGESYDLFCETNGNFQSRVNYKNRVLTVCKNSDYAITKEELINESFDSSIVSNADLPDDERERLENENSGLENLKGKAKTDSIDGGPLSGKQKTTDHLNGDPLSGETATDDVTSPLLAYGLKPGEQELDDGQLAGDISSELPEGELAEEGHTTEHLSSHYGLEQKQKKADRKSDRGLEGELGTDDVTAPLLAYGVEDNAEDNTKKESEFFDDSFIDDLSAEADGTDHLPKFYEGKTADKESQPQNPRGEGSRAEQIKTHYKNPGDKGAKNETEEELEEEALSPEAREKKAKLEKVNDLLKKARKEAAPQIEESDNVEDLQEHKERKAREKKAHGTSELRSAEEDAAGVSTADRGDNLMVLFTKAAQQYKQG